VALIHVKIAYEACRAKCMNQEGGKDVKPAFQSEALVVEPGSIIDVG